MLFPTFLCGGDMMLRIAVAALLLAVASIAIAQSKTVGPARRAIRWSARVRQMEERQSKNLIGAAEEMPADKYSYRPTPPSR